MPRPTHNLNDALNSGSKKTNPIVKLFQDRVKIRKEAAEQAARKMTDDRAANEIALIDIIDSINFVNNKIPEEYLEHKDNPEQPYGDLEYGAKAIRKLIKNSPNFTVDTKEIDTRLMNLALEYKHAVAEGHVTAAYAAKGALLTCISSIRNRIPNVSPDLVKNYIEKSAKYMDTWLLLVAMSRESDELRQSVKNEQRCYDSEAEENKRRSQELYDKLQNDPALLKAFNDIADQTSAENSHTWTPAQRTVRKLMTDQRFSDITLQFSLRMLNAEEMQLKQREGKISTLRVKVESLPIPTDPNSINKYNDELNDLFDELARIDTETDEMLTQLEEIEGRMEALENAPGEIHLRATVAEQAAKEIQKIKERQEEELHSMEHASASLNEKYGIRSQKEQDMLVEQIRNQEQLLVQQVMEQAEEQSQMLYNED